MMLRESPYPMVSIEEAHRRITACITPLASEQVDLLASLVQGARSLVGRVLAEDVYAHEPIPDLPKSAVDGYALIAADGINPRQVLAEITAGASAGLELHAGTAVRIMTGAPVPAGADAVVMVEQTTEDNGILQIQNPVRSGDSIHRIGQDMAQHELVLRQGTRLGSAEIGLLASVGHTQVLLYRRPIVAVLATGDEVFEPHGPAIPGGVRDSNRYALLMAAAEAGCDTISLGIARDDLATQREAIEHGLAQADVLLTSGGVSMGTRDLIKPLLAEIGTVHFGRIAFKPGKPTTFATAGKKLLFGLPGYPVSSLVSFEVFVRPTLRRLQGDAQPERPRSLVTLQDPIRSSPDRPEYQRAVISHERGLLVARTTGSQGSSRMLSLRGANALLHVPAGGQTYQPGDTLEALLL
jgi:molybdenum cofactor synthesis domain-containing protein